MANVRLFRDFTVGDLMILVLIIVALFLAEQIFDIRICGRHSEGSCKYVLFEPR